MRLLNTTSITLEEFQDGDIPDYAILSHMWGKKEVSFQDLAHVDGVRGMKDFSKITSACEAATRDGLDYLWVDTCCINKESSSELSEAINSMFLWYRNSRVCYALLSDVPSSEDPSPLYSSFATSKWFTRGWTLQELLAPMRVIFYGLDWVEIGTKATLQDTISAITGINRSTIVGGANFHYDVPIAVRMSWAAERQTTRAEDVAYCLMGLFDVNMPLLYGEGRKAFIRLQHEIIKKSNDQSIFAWKARESEDEVRERGLLARSPAEFYDSNEAERMGTLDHERDEVNEYAVTNQGIRIQLPFLYRSDRSLVCALLKCRISGNVVGISIKKTGDNQYLRVDAHMLEGFAGTIPKSTMPSNPLFVLDDVPDIQQDGPEYSVILKVIPSPEYGYVDYAGSLSWKPEAPNKWKFVPMLKLVDSVLVIFNPWRNEQCAVAVGVAGGLLWADIFTGFEFDGNPWEVHRSYFKQGSIRTGPGRSRYLDRSSVDLPSGWTAHLVFGIAETSSDGVIQPMAVQFRRTLLQNSLGPTWKRPPPETEVVYLIICPALHRGFTLVEEDMSQVTSYGYWPRNSRSFIFSVPRNSGAFMIPFRKSTSHQKRDFFLVLGGNPRDRTFRSTIEKKRPDITSDALQPMGKIGETCSTRLEGDELVSMTIRRSRDTSVADFIVDVSVSEIDNTTYLIYY